MFIEKQSIGHFGFFFQVKIKLFTIRSLGGASVGQKRGSFS